jgi:glycine/D-amino acid oxidase-like deaminating enzyme
MRPRDFDALGSTTCDVLVVGGGIHGLTTALDASARGLSVALVEAGDFAAATSFNHQRTAHGGCDRCNPGGSGTRASRSASGARWRASRPGCCGRCRS